jgi:hypothetical protein
MNDGAGAASFRDPSGFVFTRDGCLYRQVNRSYRQAYDRLISSGLYDALTAAGSIVPHEEAPLEMAMTEDAWKVIRPEPLSFVSYPYEWCFGQLKAAALTTLRIQKLAMAHGMTLKDSSAYNMQFQQGRCVLIDTLSFEPYEEGKPWAAYRQFCQHFFAPLALMSRRDFRLGQLLRIHIDGVPLDLAAKLLGWRCRLSLSLLLHIRMHARSQKRYEQAHGSQLKDRRLSRRALLGIVDNLEAAIRKLTWQAQDTEWGGYYTFTNYSADAFEAKKHCVAEMLRAAEPQSVWDLGANTGIFSRLASDRGVPTVAFDIDPVAVEKNYQRTVQNRETALLPLLLDLTNPPGGLGWANEERMSLPQRGPAGAVLALALIHHLAISNNLPFDRIARYFAALTDTLIIEFVPKADSQVQKLLSTRRDIFDRYDQRNFENIFGRRFDIKRSQRLEGTQRTIYLMRRK